MNAKEIAEGLTDFWRVKYAYDGSDRAHFDYLGSWQELTAMMGENLTGVARMEITYLGQRYRQHLENQHGS